MTLREAFYIQHGIELHEAQPEPVETDGSSRRKLAFLYSHEDFQQASRAVNWIEASYEVLWDRGFPSHRPWHISSEEAINSAHAVIALWSNEGKQSPNLIAEASYAKKKEKLVMTHVRGFDVGALPLIFGDLPSTLITDKKRIRALLDDMLLMVA